MTTKKWYTYLSTRYEYLSMCTISNYSHIVNLKASCTWHTDYLCITIIQSTAPSEPPQNVQATTISSTEIMVTWEEVPPIDQNGIIISYEIEYEPLQFTGELNTGTIINDATDLEVAIIGLEEYVEYNISVRAFTSVGPGPYSDPVTERTFEDGNSLLSRGYLC